MSGWQQAPIIPSRRRECAHLGAAFASLTIHLHPEGHVWVCSCGKRFVVVSSGGKDKRLVPDWRAAHPTPVRPVREAAHGEEGGS